MSGNPNELKVAILGFGTVGMSVAKLLAAGYLPGVRVVGVYNRGVARKQASPEAARVGAGAFWTEDFEDVLASDADVVVELVGGAEPAGTWIERALKAGKSVVTANKQLIAYRGPELARLASENGVQLLHGAAVAGGVPVIPGMLQGLSGDEVTRCQRHPERHLQLHPQPHGTRRFLCRRAQGRAAARLCRGRPDRRRRRLRCTREALHPGARGHARGA